MTMRKLRLFKLKKNNHNFKAINLLKKKQGQKRDRYGTIFNKNSMKRSNFLFVYCAEKIKSKRGFPKTKTVSRT